MRKFVDAAKIVNKLMREAELSFDDFESYAEDHGLDAETDDWHYIGLKRAIEIIDEEVSYNG